MNTINYRYGTNTKTPNQPKNLDKLKSINKSNQDEFKILDKTGVSPANKTASTSNNCRVDKIEISHSANSTSSTFNVSKLKSKIVSDIQAETSAQHIQNISQRISKNEYKINPTEIAKIILDD